jgi:hypothetical protein
MRNLHLALAVVVMVFVVPRAARAACPPCGDLQCVGDPTFPKARDAKKAKLAKLGFGKDRVALVDKDGPCRLCLENAPDWFTILVERMDSSIDSKTWTNEQERYARDALRTGKAKAAYVVYVRKRCACCGERPADQQPDWDARLGLSTSLAVRLQAAPREAGSAAEGVQPQTVTSSTRKGAR